MMHDGMMWGMGLGGLLGLLVLLLVIAALVKYIFFRRAVAADRGASILPNI